MNFTHNNFDLEYIENLFAYDIVNVSKNEFLFQEKMENDFVYFIIKGKIKVIKKKIVIGFTKENEFVGITSCLSENDHYYFSALTCVDSSLCRIHKSVFKKALIENPKFGKTIIELLCRRIKITDNKSESFKHHTVKERIVNEILNNVVIEKGEYISKMTNEDLAELTGVSPKIIKSKLSELKRENIINLAENSIKIMNVKHLEQIGKIS